MNNLIQILKGGSGSGDFGHTGRPGRRGGSGGGGGKGKPRKGRRSREALNKEIEARKGKEQEFEGKVIRTKQSWKDAQDEYLKETYKNMKVFPELYDGSDPKKSKKSFEKRINKLLSRYTEPRSRTTDNALSRIIDNGELKSAFETGTSSVTGEEERFSVSDYADSRRTMEERMWGKDKHPVYAYLSDGNDTANSKEYGPVIIHLKNNVKNGSTITIGDSLNENTSKKTGLGSHLSPVPYNDPNWRALNPYGFNNLTSTRKGKLTSYVELQMWDRVRLENMSKISGVDRNSISSAQLEKLRKLGVGVEFRN